MRESVAKITQALRDKDYIVIRVEKARKDVLQWYSDGRNVVILQEYGDGNGCELFVQAVSGNSIQATIDAIPG